MNTITITITRDHHDLIVKALDFYNEALKTRLTDKSWTANAEGQKIIAKTLEAPWGFKKDGTPKQRPGRKA